MLRHSAAGGATALLLCLAAVAAPLSARAGEPEFPVTPLPLRWGFDDIGTPGPDCVNEGCLAVHPKAGELLREFGFDLWVTWYPDAAPSWSIEENRVYIRRLDDFAGVHGLAWVVNPLAPLWDHAPESAVDETGFDWYLREDGRRFFLFPPAILEELGRAEHLLGLVYDEPEHHQNNANAVMGLDRPAIYDPSGARRRDAADGHSAAAAELARHYDRYGIPVFTEQVFPVMFHTFARAGFTAGTKVLKEAWTPVYLACALGAAAQYNRELWVSPDLWGLHGYPSHGPDEYRSALLLAYHLGASAIYTESLALQWGPEGEPGLVTMTRTDYEVAEFGEVARWFRKEYVPAHPRRFSPGDVRPRVAIVRREDGDWGQANTPQAFLPDRLFGSRDWKSTETTRAWLDIWHLLTRGVVPREGLAWFAYPERPYQVFCPLDGVVVFDDRVGLERLRGVEAVFLTGTGVSDATLDAVQACVRDGATCIALPHLLPERVRTQTGDAGALRDGAGRWVATKDFLADRVREAVRHVVPEQDIIRYRFGDTVVTFRPVGGDANRLAVSVTETGPAEEPH